MNSPLPNYQLLGIPNGKAGVRKTLDLMADLVEKFKTNQQVRELAVRIVSRVPAKNWAKEVQALQEWVKHNIRYTMDVKGVETLQTPVKTLELKAGDCDDHAILLASLLSTINHDARFVAVGKYPDQFSHVFVQAKIGSRWFAIETTKNWPMGHFPMKIKSKMVHHL